MYSPENVKDAAFCDALTTAEARYSSPPRVKLNLLSI